MAVAYITGTTRGLGHALVNVYTSEGWDVCEISRPAIDLRNLSFPAFISSDEAVFINNAASIAISHSFTDSEIVEELTANLISPIRLIAKFIEANPNGVVVNITSGLARKSLPDLALYCTAKAGMEGYMRSLECQGYRCINFDPGVMDTGMQAQLRNAVFSGREKFQDFKRRGLLLPPEAVARRLFLLVQDVAHSGNSMRAGTAS
jgi:benzil reductase ((S)-benzoin forming)